MEINPNAVLALIAELQTIIMGLRQENQQLRQQAEQAVHDQYEDSQHP